MVTAAPLVSPWKFLLAEDHKTTLDQTVGENFEVNNNDIHLVPMEDDYLDDIDISYSTLVKEGLRSAIATRRLSKGLPEVKAEYALPASDQLTDEDRERGRMRRERNKIAAEKCRKKRKEKEKRIVQEHNALDKRNKELLEEVEKLKQERETLVLLLHTHQAICTRRNTLIQNEEHHCPSER